MNNGTEHGKLRVSDIVLIALFALVLVIGGILVLLLPPNSFSENENRALASAPDFTFEKLADGTFERNVSEYYSDQFPARSTLVALKADTEVLALRRENGGVMIGASGYLIDRIEYGDAEYNRIADNLAAFDVFCSALETESIPVKLAVAPRAVDVLTAFYPAGFNSDMSTEVWEKSGILSVKDCTVLTDILRVKASDCYVWYRTDHHWTGYGAYFAYAALADTLGYKALPLSDFTFEKASDEFFGTTYSKAGITWVKPDIILFPRFDGDTDYVTEIENGKTFDGFYDREFLGVKDKYSVYIGGNNPLVRVTRKNGAVRKKLVLIKDSFAHSIVPYLARHYDLVIVDLRYYTGSVAELTLSEKASQVLVLYGIDSIATTNMKPIASGIVE